MSRRPVALAGLVLLAAVLRIAAIVHTHAWDAPPEENRVIAANLRAGRGFTFTQFGVTGPTAVRAPVYPMLLAVLGPDRVRLILAVNVIAGAAATAAAYALLAPKMTTAETDVRPWFFAAAIAVWPTQLFAATLTQGLSLAVALLIGSLAVARAGTPGRLILGGLLGGMAAVTEPVLAIPLLLTAIGVATFRRSMEERPTATLAALYLAAAFVPVAPWLYRNAIVFGVPTPLTSNFWPDAFLGNGPDASGDRYDDLSNRHADGDATLRPATAVDRLAPPDYDRLKRPEPQRVAVFREWTTAWIGTHALGYAGLCLRRVVTTYFAVGGHPLAKTPVYVVSRLVAGLWFAVWLARRDVPFNGAAGLAVCLIAGICLTTAFSLAEARNSVLMDVPQLIGLAAGLGRRPAKAAA